MSETISGENVDWPDENIVIRSPYEEKILLIRFAGKMTIKDTIDLYKLGLTPYSRISGNTIAKVKAENIDQLRSYPFINKIREYKPEDKITPYDKIKINEMISNKKNTSNGVESPIKIYILPLGKGNDTYIQNLQQLGVEKISYDGTAKVYSAEISPSAVNLVLNLKWVKKIEIQKEKVVKSVGLGFASGDSRELINAPYVWPFHTGNNISIGVFDTGIWDQHPDFAGAVIHSDIDESGHGTHVSGIIASRGTRNIEGSYDAKGVAYGSKLYVIDLITNTSDSLSEFKNNSIQIVSNSWVYGDYNYSTDALIIDSYVENNSMTLIFAAGNDGLGGERTINNPATAKNVITVGAISYTIGGYSGGVGKVANYSSRGPTRTSGRLKPDVVAPGGDFGGFSTKYGVVSTNAQNETGFWLDDDINRWPTDSNYTRMAGTSMAAPHVTGTVALINESFRNTSLSNGLQPRDYKALLIESAILLKGYGTDARNGYANTDVGYGLIDAYLSIFDITGEKQNLLWGHGELIETILNTQDWSININGTEKKLSITLAYEDIAGQINETNVLKNDLDLKITSPNGTLFNYTLPENVTAEEPEEKIVIDNPSIYGNGTWTIRVEGASWDTFPFDYQKYTVIANAYYVDPSLEINAASTINVAPGANFTLSPTLKNTGGLAVAGITVNVSTNASGFGGDINNDTFVGNIVGKGNSKSTSFNITAPVTLGEYNLNISAKGINHDLNTPDNKIVKVSVGSLSGWNNRKLKTINGTSVGAQTNYQMKLTVYKGSGTDTPGVVYLGGNVRDDFGDLRFTKSDGVTLLDYWIESYTSGVSAVVWVEVDSIPSSPNSTSIYLYYGNPSATSASSSAGTFRFFDDFDSSSNWYLRNGATISGGSLTINIGNKDQSAMAIYQQSMQLPYVLMYSAMILGGDPTGDSWRWFDQIGIPSGNSTTPGESWGCGYMKIYNRVLNMVFSDYAGVYTNGANLNTGVWYTVEHVVTPTFNRVTANGVSTTNTENHADNRYIGFGITYQNARHGWMAIRNYSSPEPSWS